MTDDQFEKLLTALSKATEKRSSWAEMLMRGGVTISTAGICFIGSLLWNMNDNITTMLAVQNQHGTAIQYLESFAREPRFTQEMFDNQLKPIFRMIERNGNDIEKLERKTE